VQLVASLRVYSHINEPIHHGGRRGGQTTPESRSEGLISITCIIAESFRRCGPKEPISYQDMNAMQADEEDVSDEDLQLKENLELMVARTQDTEEGVQKMAIQAIANEIRHARP
jgi:hypothetical protein